MRPDWDHYFLGIADAMWPHGEMGGIEGWDFTQETH